MTNVQMKFDLYDIQITLIMFKFLHSLVFHHQSTSLKIKTA
jgi:hypothetical protein